jgi:hypothetical protein
MQLNAACARHATTSPNFDLSARAFARSGDRGDRAVFLVEPLVGYAGAGDVLLAREPVRRLELFGGAQDSHR